MILTAYFDESGTHGGSPITVMSGLVGNALQWSRFENEIAKIKQTYNFQVLHMKDFKRRTGAFKGWSLEKCEALLGDMINITDGRLMQAVSVPLDNESYKREYCQGEKPRRMRLDSPYGLCFRICLTNLVDRIAYRLSPKRDHSLHVIVENGHKNNGDAKRIFWELKEEWDAGWFPYLKTFTLAAKDEYAPLMVADTLAHVCYLRMLDVRDGKPLPRSRDIRKKSSIAYVSPTADELAAQKRRLVERHQQWANYGKRPFSGQSA